jgi:hypothetical protein
MPDTEGFMAVVAGDDQIAITDSQGNCWYALVIAVQPDADHDLLVQEVGSSMLCLYSVVGTELNLHIEGKGDF